MQQRKPWKTSFRTVLKMNLAENFDQGITESKVTQQPIRSLNC